MRWATSGTNWRLARSLIELGEQLSLIWPQGGPADGTIGDAAHSARRSDHNPNHANVVTALDMDEVIEGRGQALVDTLVAHQDPRIKYLIHEGKIWRSYPRTGTTPWEPSSYTGSNPHSTHVHISVSSSWALYDSAVHWNLVGLEVGGNPMATISVKEWQSILNSAGITDINNNPLVEDGVYGMKTRSALIKMAKGTTVGAHSHNSLYAAKDHPHTIT